MSTGGRPLTGMAFPFRIVGGQVASSVGAEKVAADVRALLSTRVGERLLRRQYGGGLHRHLGEPDDAGGRALLRHDVELALRTSLPDLRLTGPVRVTSVGAGQLRLSLDYSLAPDAVVRRLDIAVPDAGQAAL